MLYARSAYSRHDEPRYLGRTMTSDRAIPEFFDPNFRMVNIRECSEPIIQLWPGDRLRVYPAYHARGFVTADSAIRLRASVIDALRTASVKLPEGISILVYDGFRSLQTQKEIADRFAAVLANTPMTEDERALTVARFVAPLPATEVEYRSNPPPHCTGAAVDLGLVANDGTVIDLGADFDQFDGLAATTYYESVCSKGVCSAVDRARRDRRRILYWAMIGAGFAPNPAEYWHFEFGTKRAAAFHGQTMARYGAVAPWLKEETAVA